MKGLQAALYKEFRLFLSGNRILLWLPPVILLVAFGYGLEGVSGQYIQPFPVAVCDQDDTFMSRSLIAQMKRVKLFSEVRIIEEGETDTELLDGKAAAVITIPKDFFYDLYEMKDCPINLVINENRELEASLFQAVFRSVMRIVETDQAVGRGVYDFCFRQDGQVRREAMYAEISKYLWQDVLGRQLVFHSAMEEPDIRGSLIRRLLGAFLSVLILFFTLSAIKTLPEERDLGVVARYRAAGGSVISFLCAKFFVVSVLTALALAVCMLLFPEFCTVSFFILAFAFQITSFSLMLPFAAWSDSAAEVQRWGNLLILVSLVFSGTLWPVQVLGRGWSLWGRIMPSYYFAMGLEAMAYGNTGTDLLLFVWPMALLCGMGWMLAISGWWWKGRESVKRTLPHIGFFSRRMEPYGPIGRMSGMAWMKFRIMSGGARNLLLWLVILALCGKVISSLDAGTDFRLRLAVIDLDESVYSRELIRRLSEQPGLALVLCGDDQGTELLIRGEVEGMLCIDTGYGEALGSDAQQFLYYRASASAISAQGAREIIAGQVLAQKGRIRAAAQASGHLGRELSQGEIQDLLHRIDQADVQSPVLYRVRTIEGKSVSDPFLPDEMGFAVLAVLMTIFCLSLWDGKAGKGVEQRMWSLPCGYVLSCGSDLLSTAFLGFVTAMAVLFPGGRCSVDRMGISILFCLCAAALARIFIRSTALAGRVDGTAPFLSLSLCLFGGCFLDLSKFSPGFAQFSWVMPTGLAIRAAKGSGIAFFVLLAESVLLLLVSVADRKGRERKKAFFSAGKEEL